MFVIVLHVQWQQYIVILLVVTN